MTLQWLLLMTSHEWTERCCVRLQACCGCTRSCSRAHDRTPHVGQIYNCWDYLAYNREFTARFNHFFNAIAFLFAARGVFSQWYMHGNRWRFICQLTNLRRIEIIEIFCTRTYWLLLEFDTVILHQTFDLVIHIFNLHLFEVFLNI